MAPLLSLFLLIPPPLLLVFCPSPVRSLPSAPSLSYLSLEAPPLLALKLRLQSSLCFLPLPAHPISLHHTSPPKLSTWSTTMSTSLLGILVTSLISLGMTVMTMVPAAATDLAVLQAWVGALAEASATVPGGLLLPLSPFLQYPSTEAAQEQAQVSEMATAWVDLARVDLAWVGSVLAAQDPVLMAVATETDLVALALVVGTASEMRAMASEVPEPPWPQSLSSHLVVAQVSALATASVDLALMTLESVATGIATAAPAMALATDSVGTALEVLVAPSQL